MATRVWPRVIRDPIGTGKRFILGHNQSARLDALYARGNTGITLYAGPSVAGLGSRLSAHATDGLLRRTLPIIAVETCRRAIRGRRPRER